MFPDEFFKLQHRVPTRKNQSGSQQSQTSDKKQQNDIYFSKYFLNNSFKILYIDIIAIKQVQNSFDKCDSYIIYIIKIMTQDYCYEIVKRYSEFLKLYQKIVQCQMMKKNKQNINEVKAMYLFPSKKISFSFLKLFKITNNQKIAEGRKPYLSSFLNQIKNNYTKFPNQFTDHYVELLKFINMKQQHQKFWKRKSGKTPQISDPILQTTAMPTRQSDKLTQNTQINIQHLSQLLQHQINKINLSISTKNSIKKSTLTYPSLTQTENNTDSVIIDQIIKNVDTIKDIVLEMKRKITLDHIRCILKGKDISEGKSMPNCEISSSSKTKIGLIEFSLKHAKNQLVAIHTMKTILTVLLNSQCNYSSESFLKILAELEPKELKLNTEQQHLSEINKEYRQLYFKLIKQYIIAKQQYGNNKKNCKYINEIMNNTQLSKIYDKWLQKDEKNKSFKLKDDQKQWMMVIQNLAKNQQEKNNNKIFSSFLEKKKDNSQPGKNVVGDQQNTYQQQCNNKDKQIKEKLPSMSSTSSYTNQPKQNTINYQKRHKQKNLQINLRTEKTDQYSKYFLRLMIGNINYNNCIELIKNEKNWNSLLIDSQLDLYSNTRKQRYKIPGKQEKMFRFICFQDIQMALEDQELDSELPFDQIPLNANQEDISQQVKKNNQNTKMSINTQQSITTSCTDQLPPDHPSSSSFPTQQLSCSQLSQKIIFIKSPPQQGKFNSFTQKITIQKIKPINNIISPCLIQIQIYITQASSIKFFNSQIECTTSYIFDGIIELFRNLSSDESI